MQQPTYSSIPHAAPAACSWPPGRIIAATRALLGQSAERLAAAAGISPYSLSRLERGHRAPISGELGRLLVTLSRLAGEGADNV